MTAKNRKITGLVAFALIAIVSLFGYTILTASAASGLVQDAKGDADSATESATSVGAGTPTDIARGYLDIKQAKVTKKKGTGQYVFSMVMAEPVPQDMSSEVCYTLTGAPGSTETILTDAAGCFFAWNWNVDSDDVWNIGNDLTPTVRWRQGAFQGIAFTTNPDGTAGDAILFDTFKISGANVSATLDADVVESWVGSSDGFMFAGATRNHRIDFGAGGDPMVGIADVTDVVDWE